MVTINFFIDSDDGVATFWKFLHFFRHFESRHLCFKVKKSSRKTPSSDISLDRSLKNTNLGKTGGLYLTPLQNGGHFKILSKK